MEKITGKLSVLGKLSWLRHAIILGAFTGIFQPTVYFLYIQYPQIYMQILIMTMTTNILSMAYAVYVFKLYDEGKARIKAKYGIEDPEAIILEKVDSYEKRWSEIQRELGEIRPILRNVSKLMLLADSFTRTLDTVESLSEDFKKFNSMRDGILKTLDTVNIMERRLKDFENLEKEVREALSKIVAVESAMPKIEGALSGLKDVQTALPELRKGLSKFDAMQSEIPQIRDALKGLKGVEVALPELRDAMNGLKSLQSVVPEITKKFNDLQERFDKLMPLFKEYLFRIDEKNTIIMV